MLLCPNPKCGDIGESKICLQCGYDRVPIPAFPEDDNVTDAELSARIFDDKPKKKLTLRETSDEKADKQQFKFDVCSFCQCVLETGSRFCHSCGEETRRLESTEVVFCGAIKDDQSTCNEEVKKTQNFCKTCGAKVNKQRFKPDICKSCQCVLESGSRFCQNCGAKTKVADIAGAERTTVVDKKQSNLDEETESICTTMAGACKVTPEPIEPSEREAESGPGFPAEETKQMEIAVKGGVSKIQEYIKARNNEWKLIPLHIAVTGNTGVGKSSFINALRGVRKGQKGYAEVDVTETTSKLTGYPHPQNESLVFWDMPGVGTLDYPKNNYLKKVEFEKYDFFLILTSGRFTENDMWLAKEIRRQKKAFYFIRTKIGYDVDNERQKDPNSCETDVIAKILNDCIVKLSREKFEDTSIFLIDSYSTAKYDFGTLVDSLLKNLPEKKREALALSLTFMTKEVIMAKRSALRKRIFFISVGSAIGGAVPLLGFGAAVDTAIILEEAEEYKRQFGLTDEALLKHNPKRAQLIKDKYLQNLAQMMATVTIDEAAENAAKFGIPILGSIVSGTISYGVSVTVLWRLLNSMTDDALKLNEDMIKKLSSETDL